MVSAVNREPLVHTGWSEGVTICLHCYPADPCTVVHLRIGTSLELDLYAWKNRHRRGLHNIEPSLLSCVPGRMQIWSPLNGSHFSNDLIAITLSRPLFLYQSLVTLPRGWAGGGTQTHLKVSHQSLVTMGITPLYHWSPHPDDCQGL